MSRYVRGALGVLVSIVIASTFVFETVQLAGTAGAGRIAVAMTCPATGCTSSSCHAATGAPTPTASTSADGGLLTCPATGCTASTCHATSGGSSGGGGRGFRGGASGSGEAQGRTDYY